ncbi:MAG: EAL domain-containing response regulator, partial [Myxococcota bacterium]
VIEDEIFTRAMTVRLLKKLGVEPVFEAGSGARALDLLGEVSSPDSLIVIDLNLPDVDGVQFLRLLAERKHQAGIVILSQVEPRVLRTARELAQTYGLHLLDSIPKPLTRDALSQVLQKSAAPKPPRTRRSISAEDEPIDADEIRQGLLCGEFEAWFQPKVATQSRNIVGVEALARWRHPDRGILSPYRFIPLAEELGLIDELTQAILTDALRWSGHWRSQGLVLGVSVNVSVRSLHRLDLPELVANMARKHGVDMGHITLEITESGLVQRTSNNLEILTRLRMRNVGLSIDDFGTGYSSLEQLRRVPFTELKLDRSFVSRADQDPDSRAILQSSVALARQLDLLTVAEGVETEQEWALVRDLGCEQVQGYLIARPMSGELLLPWAMDRRRPWAAVGGA